METQYEWDLRNLQARIQYGWHPQGILKFTDREWKAFNFLPSFGKPKTLYSHHIKPWKASLFRKLILWLTTTPLQKLKSIIRTSA